jgi:hypothetical protein
MEVVAGIAKPRPDWTEGSTLPVRALAFQFILPIIPIAVVYNVTHNLTHILAEWIALTALLTDPFGFGWNLLYLSTTPTIQLPIQMGPVWHVEVALMLGGHVIGVYLPHLTALRPSRRAINP